ncbi:hypothetical protein SRABI83_04199 [Arthrobacter sp. Bi83]|jgi:hypothetical protein|nr:hypothetical protein SRABI83_04199 [Arthrobacter sp. Bi83]
MSTSEEVVGASSNLRSREPLPESVAAVLLTGKGGWTSSHTAFVAGKRRCSKPRLNAPFAS